MRHTALALWLAVAWAAVPALAFAQDAVADAAAVEAAVAAAVEGSDGALEDFDVVELVRRAEDALRGDTAEMRAVMTVTTPRWTREIGLHSYDDRVGDRSFIRILSPRKDRGTGFLRVENTFWTYLPRVERTMRIPPSMMLQPWMGSDLTNDDIARESSMIDDYDAKAIGIREVDGVPAYGAELIPKPEAPVVWDRLELWIEKARLAPLRFRYYEEGENGGYDLVREMRFADIRDVQGRPVPHAWEVIPEDKPGHRTSMILQEITLDQAFQDGIFTQRNLRNPEGAR